MCVIYVLRTQVVAPSPFLSNAIRVHAMINKAPHAAALSRIQHQLIGQGHEIVVRNA